jgi:hypothetical protein
MQEGDAGLAGGWIHDRLQKQARLERATVIASRRSEHEACLEESYRNLYVL